MAAFSPTSQEMTTLLVMPAGICRSWCSSMTASSRAMRTRPENSLLANQPRVERIGHQEAGPSRRRCCRFSPGFRFRRRGAAARRAGGPVVRSAGRYSSRFGGRYSGGINWRANCPIGMTFTLAMIRPARFLTRRPTTRIAAVVKRCNIADVALLGPQLQQGPRFRAEDSREPTVPGEKWKTCAYSGRR